MNKFLKNWFFPAMALFMFATLLGAILLQTNSLSPAMLFAYSASPLAYSMMLVGLFIASRPRFIEKHVGMPRMYEIHAIFTIIAFFLATIHIVTIWAGFGAMFRSLATTFGYLGYLGILMGMFSGMLSLSGMFIGNNKTLRNLKENVLNREIMLWVQRIGGLTAIIGTFLQMVFIPFLRANTPYMVLLVLYTVLILGYYAVWRLQIAQAPKYKVSKIYKATPSLWVLEFEPENGQLVNYNPGDYFFIRFQDADITGEAHPFSTSSAITKQFSSSIEFMIKEAGDWTESLANIKVGDIATLEGAYGDFYPEVVRTSDKPYVLMGGGIGLTPVLSILRSEVELGSQRNIQLVWALSWKDDMFMLDELESYKQVNPNFEYHIIFSNEEVEGYPFGFISTPYLAEIKVNELYQEAYFFICGPDIMMSSTKKVLLDNGVPEDHIYVDDFGF